MLTEQRNPRTMELDQHDTLAMLQLINTEDATVTAAVAHALPQIAAAVEMIVTRLRAGGRLIYIGAGTSGRLGVLDASECVPTFSVPPGLVVGIIAGGDYALRHAVEGAEDDPDAGAADLQAITLTAQDTVVGIAASGRTPYVIGALKYAREVGAGTVALSCNQPAPVLAAAEVPIAVLTGPEVLTGSTRLKAGTAQKLVLNMLSTASMVRLGKVYGNLMVDVSVSNHKLADRAQRILSEITGLPPEAATALLQQTSYEVKPAVVMAMLGVTATEARARLDAAQGVLAAVISR